MEPAWFWWITGFRLTSSCSGRFGLFFDVTLTTTRGFFCMFSIILFCLLLFSFNFICLTVIFSVLISCRVLCHVGARWDPSRAPFGANRATAGLILNIRGDRQNLSESLRVFPLQTQRVKTEETSEDEEKLIEGKNKEMKGKHLRLICSRTAGVKIRGVPVDRQHLRRVVTEALWTSGPPGSGVSPPGSSSSWSDRPRRRLEVEPDAACRLDEKPRALGLGPDTGRHILSSP